MMRNPNDEDSNDEERAMDVGLLAEVAPLIQRYGFPPIAPLSPEMYRPAMPAQGARTGKKRPADAPGKDVRTFGCNVCHRQTMTVTLETARLFLYRCANCGNVYADLKPVIQPRPIAEGDPGTQDEACPRR
jgi:hypothetical protein